MAQSSLLETIDLRDVVQITSLETKDLRNVVQVSLPVETSVSIFLWRNRGGLMKRNGMYFAKNEMYELIKSLGGQWNDSKDRPIYCCLESNEISGLYWAIPVGSYEHRTPEAKIRINRYLNYHPSIIASCYYHIGTTTQKSIFFISDVIPITDKYMDAEYINNYTGLIHIVKNKQLIIDIERKLARILAYENSQPNVFRQRITDVKLQLISELNDTINCYPQSIT